SPEESKYPAAATLLRKWLDDGVLARDAQPAIYRYHQRFDAYGKEVTRKGFIARVRLHRFDEGVILPHERTLSGPKLDRLKLMRALSAHEFSQVFSLYPDPARESDRIFEAVEATAPALEARTADGVVQRAWRLRDPRAIAPPPSRCARRSPRTPTAGPRSRSPCPGATGSRCCAFAPISPHPRCPRSRRSRRCATST